MKVTKGDIVKSFESIIANGSIDLESFGDTAEEAMKKVWPIIEYYQQGPPAEILKILDNVTYWDGCPRDYQEKIKGYLEQLKV